jgi:serine/threonine protein kinase/tetratricopeptide (TPR) repeat protein
MHAERWRQLQELFALASDLPVDQRRQFLDSNCAGDPELRAEIETLIAADAKQTGWLSRFVNEAATAMAGPEAARWTPGLRIGPYEIVRELSRGGMGIVFLAERADQQFRRRVAIKVVRASLASPDLLTRFRTERQILAQLDHPNIARLLDGGATESGEPYVVMEFIDGLPIDQYCDAHALTVDDRVELFRTICAAVQYAHGNLVVHRDLKPGNILVTAAGVPKLLDFGIAKLLAATTIEIDVSQTRTRERLLTPSHASPEQVRGESITTASDIYSMGVLLYELLSGKAPYRFRTQTERELERVICEEEPVAPSHALGRPAEGKEPDPYSISRARSTTPDRLRRKLAGDLDTIVLMAMRKEPMRRYASADQLGEDLRRHAAGLPVIARKDTVPYRIGKFTRRHPRALGATAAIVVVIAALIAFYTTRLAAERDRALAAAAKSEQVASFLSNVFAISNPSEARGRTVTARELLDRGAARIAEELDGQPDVQADLMELMGNVYLGLGLYDESVAILERALQARRAVSGELNAGTAHTLNALGVVHRLKANFVAAESLAAKGLDIQRQLYGEEHLETAHSMADLAEVLRVRGDLARAEPLYRRALEVRRKLLGPADRDLADTMNNFALVLFGRGDYAAAEAMHRDALAMRRQVLGEDHIDVANSYDNLAMTLAALERYDEAERIGRDALRLNQKLLGDTEPRTLRIKARLARTLYGKRDLDAAEPLMRETLVQLRARMGENHPYVAYAIAGLASIRQARGDRVAADSLHTQALALRRQLLSASSPDLAESLHDLGALRIEQDRCDRALTLLRAALEIRRAALIPGHSATANTEKALTRCQA